MIESDKYLQKHKLNTNCKKTDKIRAITADVLQKETIEKQQKVTNHMLNSPLDKDSDHPVDKDLDYGDNDETEDSDSNDLVFNDLDFEVENEENEDEDLNSEEDLIVTTRYGRTAGSWRLAFTWWLYAHHPKIFLYHARYLARTYVKLESRGRKK